MNLPYRIESQRITGRSAASGAPAVVCVGLVLAMGWHQASAATLGHVATSVGFFVALAALLMSQALPAQISADGLSTLGATLVISAAAAVLWRMRRTSFASGLLSFAPRAAGVPASRVAPSALVALPAGFDREALLTELRCQFVRLQAAWDAREVEVLRALTTPEMLVELCTQLPDCSGEPNRTDVMTLHARLLGFDDLGSAYLASVEFTGMIRECAEGGAVPFRELWMLARPKHEGAGWRLARQLDLP